MTYLLCYIPVLILSFQFEGALKLLDADYGGEGLQDYTARIFEGEKTLGQLKVELRMMIGSKSIDQNQKETRKGIEQRTHKASRLKNIITDSFNNNQFQVRRLY